MTQIFSEGFGPYTFSGDTITATRDGFTYTATVLNDTDHGAPWEECDGHGPVSDWTSRDKLPGELVLRSDRGSKRFYDFAEACRIARRDGWGFAPGPVRTARNSGRVWHAWFEGVQGPYGTSAIDGTESDAIAAVYAAHKATYPSARAYAAAAARHDYETLRAWCSGDWSYCGIDVTVTDSDGTGVVDKYTCALWGIEMNYPQSGNAHLLDFANELADDAHAEYVLPMLQAGATVAALAGVGA